MRKICCYCRKVEDQTHSNVIIHELDLSCPGSLLLLNSANGNFKWVPRGEFIRPFPSPHSIRPFEFRINDFCRVMTNVRINSEPFNLQDSINHVMMQMAKVRKDSLRIPRMKSYSSSSLPLLAGPMEVNLEEADNWQMTWRTKPSLTHSQNASEGCGGGGRLRRKVGIHNFCARWMVAQR